MQYIDLLNCKDFANDFFDFYYVESLLLFQYEREDFENFDVLLFNDIVRYFKIQHNIDIEDFTVDDELSTLINIIEQTFNYSYDNN